MRVAPIDDALLAHLLIGFACARTHLASTRRSCQAIALTSPSSVHARNDARNAHTFGRDGMLFDTVHLDPERTPTNTRVRHMGSPMPILCVYVYTVLCAFERRS